MIYVIGFFLCFSLGPVVLSWLNTLYLTGFSLHYSHHITLLRHILMNLVRTFAYFICPLVFLCACNSVNTLSVNTLNEEQSTFIPRAENQYLSQKQALSRSSRVSDVRYKLSFSLSEEEAFTASSNIEFTLSNAKIPLTIDLNEAEILKLEVNGKLAQYSYNKWFITLPANVLVEGKNSVNVLFKRLYSDDGEGLHRFVDPIDDKVYLYSHFEPAAAQQMFALFDQPDLKATYTLSVSAPANWSVLSAMKESRVEDKATTKVWHFDATPKLSPYNFSLHAGPYQVWHNNQANYPLRLFARQSVAKQIKPEDWFTYTTQGLTFFENYYGVKYPFTKYDQILVPDFLYGAMENAAAITFSERSFLTNGEMSQSKRERLANVILHEMAHQWFGNLVTMKWWNGLWLNESFAAFMATLATAESTEFKGAWRTFYAKGKQSAYREDQSVTTHPIEVPIPSTANAFDNIDAITYSKGASALSQLRHLLGKDIFRQGIEDYLTTHTYKNAVLDDLIQSLAKAGGRNLDSWKQEWLYKAGVNTIKVNFECINDEVSHFEIVQSADVNFPTLREQKVQLALFQLAQSPDHKDELKLVSAIPYLYKGHISQVKALQGKPCPDLVYPNYEDWGFVKVQLDGTSFETTKKHINKVQEPFLRSMLWQSLWDSVRDGELPLNEYVDLALNNISQEQDYTILGQVLSHLEGSLHYLNKFDSSDNDYVSGVRQKLEQLTWDNLKSANKVNMRRWFSAYREFASSTDALSTLEALLNGDEKLEGLTINQDLRWLIIAQLNRYQYENSEQLIQTELIRDKSDAGVKAAIYAEVIRPNEDLKNSWLAIIHENEEGLSLAKLRSAMQALYPSEQHHLSEKSAEQIINNIVKVDGENDHTFMRSYNRYMIPENCSIQSVNRLQQAVTRTDELSEATKRALLVSLQNDKRCLQIKNKMSIQ